MLFGQGVRSRQSEPDKETPHPFCSLGVELAAGDIGPQRDLYAFDRLRGGLRR